MGTREDMIRTADGSGVQTQRAAVCFVSALDRTGPDRTGLLLCNDLSSLSSDLLVLLNSQPDLK